jgi:hypothetical protein
MAKQGPALSGGSVVPSLMSMTKTSPFGIYETADSIEEGVVEPEVIHRMPAGEGWQGGDEVGIVKAEGFVFWCGWKGDEISLHCGWEPPNRGVLPGATRRCIADNTAIDYGL